MPKTINEAVLFDILKFKRPAGSGTEKHIIRKYIDSIPHMAKDFYGNRYIEIGENPETLISCHTDTVHTLEGKQRIELIGDTIALSLDQKPIKKGQLSYRTKSKYNKECLGSDDGAGLYAALRMIQAKVPALYIFHRAEEIGGLGSDWISRYNPALLANIKRAIALDRRGYEDIITHQMMGRCCSDDFAWELADALEMGHAPCPYGTFTDTANYTDLIGECTNVAIGYKLEHTHRESVNVEYVERLIAKLVKLDFDMLCTKRKPGDAGWSYDNDDKWTEYRDLPMGLSDSSSTAARSVGEVDAWVNDYNTAYGSFINDDLSEDDLLAMDLDDKADSEALRRWAADWNVEYPEHQISAQELKDIIANNPANYELDLKD